MLRLVDMTTSVYRFDLHGHIREVYYSKHRELLREFCTLSEFENYFFDQELAVINDRLHDYFSLGYRYLATQQEEGFIEFTFDDENINFKKVNMSEIKRYLVKNAMAHLFASIALWLMDNTDIEDSLSPDYELTKMTPWYMTFSYRK